MKRVKLAVKGFFMALVNGAPGISGSTVALLLGFYDDMIGAINDVFYSNIRRKRGILYLLTLGAGWIVGIVLSIALLDSIFDECIYAISSLFFGVVLCSIPIMIYDERECLRGKYYNILFMILGAALIGWISYTASNTNSTMDLEVFSFGTASTLFFAGFFATVATLLPGISGTTVFMVFGIYRSMLSGINSLIHFNFSPLPTMLFMLAGAVIGGLGGVRLLKRCLTKYRRQTVYTSIGMLIGSLYSIMLGPTTLKTPQGWMSPGRINYGYLILGVVIVAVIQIFKINQVKKSKKEVACKQEAEGEGEKNDEQ